MASARSALSSAVMLCALLLFASVSPIEGMKKSSPQKDFNNLVKFLKKNMSPYSKLLGLLGKTGLDGALLAAVKGGTKVTILAPTNNAFKKFKLKCDVKNVLLDHAIPARLPASVVLAAPEGFTIKALGPNNVTKVKAMPLTLGIKKSRAVVKAPNAFTSKSIVLHGINAVLQAC